jgi:hypothetical protein
MMLGLANESRQTYMIPERQVSESNQPYLAGLILYFLLLVVYRLRMVPQWTSMCAHHQGSGSRV